MARILNRVLWCSLLPFWMSAGYATEVRELQDPMRPPAPASARPGASLGGPGAAASSPLWAVRFQAGHPQALILGRWVKVGDDALGGTVTAIDESGIHLKKNGVIEHLTLLPEIAATTRRSSVSVSP